MSSVIDSWLLTVKYNLQADEDREDRDERWDPDSDMEVDDERYFILYLIYILFYFFQSLVLCFSLAVRTENPFQAELKEKRLSLKSKIRYVLIEYRMSYFCSCPCRVTFPNNLTINDVYISCIVNFSSQLFVNSVASI